MCLDTHAHPLTERVSLLSVHLHANRSLLCLDTSLLCVDTSLLCVDKSLLCVLSSRSLMCVNTSLLCLAVRLDTLFECAC